MKPSELAQQLRIGNYLQYLSGDTFTVTAQDILNISNWAGNPAYLPKPIPLDAEWLERLQIPDGVFSGNEYFSVAPLKSNPKVYGLYFENEYTGMDFRYVHDLQNFSALTDTELTKKKEI